MNKTVFVTGGGSTYFLTYGEQPVV